MAWPPQGDTGRKVARDRHLGEFKVKRWRHHRGHMNCTVIQMIAKLQVAQGANVLQSKR